MERKRKKGITPLMATLLLISFAVAIGVVIMNFGRAQVEEEAQCSINVGLQFSVIGGEEQFCFERATSQLYFSVENGANIGVEGLVVNIIGSQQAKTFDLTDAEIIKAGTYLKYLEYSEEEIGELRQIKIVPIVNMYDEDLVCQEQAIILEELRDCD